MAIDAIIEGVSKMADGTVRLSLGSRKGSCSGQQVLVVENPKDGMEACIGTEIWGGASDIMVGKKKWADRIGYTRIRLVDTNDAAQAAEKVSDEG